jgi:hypothetical protein
MTRFYLMFVGERSSFHPDPFGIARTHRRHNGHDIVAEQFLIRRESHAVGALGERLEIWADARLRTRCSLRPALEPGLPASTAA